MQFPKVTSGEAATNFAAAAIALRQLGGQEPRNQAVAVTGCVHYQALDAPRAWFSLSCADKVKGFE